MLGGAIIERAEHSDPQGCQSADARTAETLPALEAYEAGRADGLRSAHAIARALANENKALRAALERVLDLLIAVEESRRHGFVTASVLQVEEVVAFARSLLMTEPSEWVTDEGHWWPETLTDDQAETVALRFAAASDEPPSIGLVKTWYGAILASLPLLRIDDKPPEDWHINPTE